MSRSDLHLLASLATSLLALLQSGVAAGARDEQLEAIIRGCRTREAICKSYRVTWRASWLSAGSGAVGPTRVQRCLWVRHARRIRFEGATTAERGPSQGQQLWAYRYTYDGRRSRKEWRPRSAGMVQWGHNPANCVESYDRGDQVLMLRDPLLARKYSDLLTGRASLVGTSRVPVTVQRRAEAAHKGGEPCYVVDVALQSPRNRRSQRLTLYFPRARAGAIVRLEGAEQCAACGGAWHTHIVIQVMQWMDVEGLPFPASSIKRTSDGGHGTSATVYYSDIAVDRPPSYPDGYFTLAFRPGTLVHDQVAMIDYAAGGRRLRPPGGPGSDAGLVVRAQWPRRPPPPRTDLSGTPASPVTTPVAPAPPAAPAGGLADEDGLAPGASRGRGAANWAIVAAVAAAGILIAGFALRRTALRRSQASPRTHS